VIDHGYYVLLAGAFFMDRNATKITTLHLQNESVWAQMCLPETFISHLLLLSFFPPPPSVG